MLQEHYLWNVALNVPGLESPESSGLLRSRFIPFCRTDRAPLHAVVLMAASHYRNAHGAQSHTIDILQVREMAMAEVNNALQDSVRSISDQIIAAVAQLACYEALFGDRNIFNMHMTGVTRMVSLRGGLSALGVDGLLERILLWVDSNTAHITGSRVYFDRTLFPSNVDHPRPDPRRFAGRSPQHSPS